MSTSTIESPSATTIRRVVAERIAHAPLTLVPIRILTEHADRDTLGRWVAEWEQQGLVTTDVHLDAIVILDRRRLATAA